MRANEAEDTQEWSEYQRGIDYKRGLNLYENVDKNERFFCGRQWEGVTSNGLPTPVFNFIKKVVQYKVSAIMADNVKMKFSGMDIPDEPTEQQDIQAKEIAELFSSYSETDWERLKMKHLCGQGLKDAALSGDFCIYFYWDTSIETSTEVMGNTCGEIIDNVNVFLGNPNTSKINSNGKPYQPYVIIASRQLISELKDEARANGMSDDEVEDITRDDETTNQSGDNAKKELDMSNKCIALLKLWHNKETKTIWARKVTKTATVRKDYDTQNKIYPLAIMNWEESKNCCHGVAEVTGLIPNQLFVNKAFASWMLSAMYYSFPKAIYDSSRIKSWNNLIGSAIPVAGEISNAAQFLTPQASSTADLSKLIDMTLSYTKELMGASEASLGEVDPKNTSAIIAVQQAAAIPLEMIKNRFYNFVEDIGLIWLDFWMSKFTAPRKITLKNNGINEVREVDLSQYQGLKLKLKIDVGEGSQWSEISAIQTLDNLLQSQQIDFVEYLERLPDGLIPMKQALMDKRKEMLEQQKALEMQPNQLPQIPQGQPQEDGSELTQTQDQVLQEVLASMTEEQLEQLKENPDILEQIFNQT